MNALFEKQKFLDVIEFIKGAHGSQTRQFSMAPYWTHPIRVATLVMKFKESKAIDELVIAALCHDVVEDTKIGIEHIRINYGDQVASLVDELTSDSKAIRFMGKTKYLVEKMLAMSSWGLVIKLCDRLDNCSDLIYADAAFRDKYIRETDTILEALMGFRELSATHLEIITHIEMMLDMARE
jgi:GTP pyrophosphokinase